MPRAAGTFQRWLNAGLALLYPEVCQLCKPEPATPRAGYVGSHCWSPVRFIRPPFCDRCGMPFAGDLTTSFVWTNCHENRVRPSFGFG